MEPTLNPETKSRKSTVITIIVIIALIVLGIWWFSGNDNQTPEFNETGEVNGVTTDERTINTKHTFIDGVHTIVGEIDLPTPCDLLDHSVEITPSDPEQVTIKFTTINESGGACAQVITPARFKVTFEASAQALIGATLNGAPVILNIIEAAPGENLDDFEIYIKG